MTFQIPIYFKRTYFMNHTNCLKLADFFVFFLICPIFIKDFKLFQIKNPIYFLYNLLQLWTYFQKEMGKQILEMFPDFQSFVFCSPGVREFQSIAEFYQVLPDKRLGAMSLGPVHHNPWPNPLPYPWSNLWTIGATSDCVHTLISGHPKSPIDTRAR